MKKVLVVVLMITIAFTLSGCSNNSDELKFNEKYRCMVYDYNDEETIDMIKSYKIVNNTLFNSTKNGVYLLDYDDNEYYFSGSAWKVVCVKEKIIN